jgi:hypothetical protein
MEASTNADSAALGMKIHNEQNFVKKFAQPSLPAFLPKTAHFCPCLGISAHVWAFLGISGQNCLFLPISGQKLSMSGHFCPKLPISAHVWAFPPMSGHFCPVLARICPFLARICPFLARNACARASCPGLPAWGCLCPPIYG